MEKLIVKHHKKSQGSPGKTDWVKVNDQSESSGVDEENPELVNKVKFVKPEKDKS
jgi:hypothetical protein